MRSLSRCIFWNGKSKKASIRVIFHSKTKKNCIENSFLDNKFIISSIPTSGRDVSRIKFRIKKLQNTQRLLLVFFFIFLQIFVGNAQLEDDENPNRYRFRYKSETYKGTRVQITSQLRALKNNSKFSKIPQEKLIALNSLFKKAKEQPIPQLYRKRAIIFLDALYSYEEFVEIYDSALVETILHLKQDMRRLDFKFERQYTKAKVLLERTTKEDPENHQKIANQTTDVKDSHIKLLSHRWMKKKFDQYRIDIIRNPDELIHEFIKVEAMNAFTLFEEKKSEQINSHLENQIIKFFHNKSLPELYLDQLELNYISKL